MTSKQTQATPSAHDYYLSTDTFTNHCSESVNFQRSFVNTIRRLNWWMVTAHNKCYCSDMRHHCDVTRCKVGGWEVARGAFRHTVSTLCLWKTCDYIQHVDFFLVLCIVISFISTSMLQLMGEYQRLTTFSFSSVLLLFVVLCRNFWANKDEWMNEWINVLYLKSALSY